MERKHNQKEGQNATVAYRTEFNLGVMTRDGIRLATITHIPIDGMARDTIIIRNPYNATGFFGLVKMMAQSLPITLNYVVQDVRGRYNSDGKFNPFNEANDSIDTLDWITEQPWSNGKVHFFGPSYLGWIGLQAVTQCKKTNATIESVFTPMTFSDLTNNTILTDGVLNLHHAYPWSIMMSGRIQGSLENMNTPFPEAYDLALSHGVSSQGYPSDLWDLLSDFEYLDSLKLNFIKDTNFSTKVTFIASYYDNVCRASIDAFEKVSDIGGIQPNLIIGPWGHNGYINSLDSIGTFKITNAQANVINDLIKHLQISADPVVKKEQSIKVYVLRKDEWYEFNQWPLPTTSLEIEFPFDSTQRRIIANYDDPVRTTGGPVWTNHLVEGLHPGPYDQRVVNNRADVLRFYSEPFREDTTIMGNVIVKVISSGSISGSHITAKLNLVDEEGAEYIINNGIHIIEEANEMKERDINLGFTSFETRTGEKLMIEISWSNYPQYEKPRHGKDYTLQFESNQKLVLSLQILQ